MIGFMKKLVQETDIFDPRSEVGFFMPRNIKNQPKLDQSISARQKQGI